MVFQSQSYGKVLILDGVIQATERDEFSYQEMIAHLPLCSIHDPPKKVLVVGGGDGGVLREIIRHPTVEHLDIAEIDGMVIEVSKKFFPGMSCGFDDPRVHVNVCDGIKFVGDAPEDLTTQSSSTRPTRWVGVGALREAVLREDLQGAQARGVLTTQGECIWLHAELIKDVLEMCGWHLSWAVRCSTGTAPSRRTPAVRSGSSCAQSPRPRGRRWTSRSPFGRHPSLRVSPLARLFVRSRSSIRLSGFPAGFQLALFPPLHTHAPLPAWHVASSDLSSDVNQNKKIKFENI